MADNATPKLKGVAEFDGGWVKLIWQKEEMRFAIYDPYDALRPPVGYLIPYEFWDGWQLWAVNEDGDFDEVETYFCQRLGEASAQAGAWLADQGYIDHG